MYPVIENHFLRNFNAREIKKDRRLSDLTPWDGHMTFFTIAIESNIVGKSLFELKLREEFGINIAFIKRGEITINIPNRTERIFPGDELCVIGNDNQIKEFSIYLKRKEIMPAESKKESPIVLQQLELNNDEFIGKSISQSQLREKTQGLVVGIERRGTRILNPESNMILEKNDILWVVGNKKLLAELLNLSI